MGKKALEAMRAVAERYRVPPDGKFKIRDVDPAECALFADREEADKILAQDVEAMMELQRKLYASKSRALLVVLQAMDTGGKDGVIRHVFGPLNPQGVRVTNFGRPTDEELLHDYLWRIHRVMPARGLIGVFNRSHYEDVLIVRVHKMVPIREIDARYEQINAFEKHLVENGVTLVKIHLCISRDEQRARLQERLDDPAKNWKFDPGDVTERERWDDYMTAYDLVLNRCSTKHAPWFVIPADRKWYRNAVVARLVRHVLEEMDLHYPDAKPGLDKVVVP